MHSVRKHTRRLNPALLGLVLTVAALAASACYPDNPQSTFGTAGPVAKLQADLFKFIFWIAVAVFVIVEAAVIIFSLKFRAKRGEGLPEQTHGNTKLELTWTIIPALILVAIAIPTIKGIYETAEPPSGSKDVLEIQAIGHQWWFEFRYPDSEVITANELHVPTGRPVVVKLRSQDVIHSFWIPKLAGKVDMVPTRENHLWFQADEAGVYFGQCAEFCGISHAKMRFRVIAEEPEKYAAWIKGMRTPPDAPAGTAAEGRTLFAGNCSTCHTSDSYRDGAYAAEITQQDNRFAAWLANPDPEGPTASRIVSAPNLTNFGERITFAAGLRDLTRDSLVEWIRDPSSIKQGTHMQAHAAVYQETDDNTAKLTDVEIGEIADYLLSLKPGEGAVVETPDAGGATGAEKGRQLAAANGCTACHSTGDNTVVGPGWKGIYEIAATRRPGLSADAYIKESIKTPAAFLVPGFGPIMPPFAGLSDKDITDIIEYMKTLK